MNIAVILAGYRKSIRKALPKFLKLQENGLEHAVDALRKNYFDR
jgi:hypothetical protein